MTQVIALSFDLNTVVRYKYYITEDTPLNINRGHSVQAGLLKFLSIYVITKNLPLIILIFITGGGRVNPPP
jgi:hypothetical protein